jgi:uncharacterized membrane protein YqaE (UPF0057 family)
MSTDLEPARDFWRVLFSWFLPPVGVALKRGIGVDLVINVVLWMFFWLPGLIHAVWLISATDERGIERGDASRRFWSLVLCALVPPVGVFLSVGLAPAFWINLLLTFFFWFPGMLHAAWVITQRRG